MKNGITFAAAASLLLAALLGCSAFDDASNGRNAANTDSANITPVNAVEENTGIDNSAVDNSVAEPPSSPMDPVPDKAALNELIQGTTSDLSNAMLTSDFSKAYANMSAVFRENVTEVQFKDSFMRDLDKTDLTPDVLKQLAGGKLEPILKDKAYIARNVNVKTGATRGSDTLVVEGSFTTKPKPSSFRYEYVKEDGKWKAKKVLL